MKMILPHPVLTICLTIFWLILQQSVSVGHILLGAAIGIFAGLATSRLGLVQPRLSKPWVIFELFAVVLFDIVRSNIAVAWVILTQGNSPSVAGFVRVPLTLRDHTTLSFLAMVLTATPGTVWLEFDEERGELLLHILDLVDEQQWIDLITDRYERRLLEIIA